MVRYRSEAYTSSTLSRMPLQRARARTFCTAPSIACSCSPSRTPPCSIQAFFRQSLSDVSSITGISFGSGSRAPVMLAATVPIRITTAAEMSGSLKIFRGFRSCFTILRTFSLSFGEAQTSSNISRYDAFKAHPSFNCVLSFARARARRVWTVDAFRPSSSPTSSTL